MSDSIRLEAKTRETAGAKLQTLRGEGRVPAVVYGHGVKPVMVSVDERLFGTRWPFGCGRMNTVLFRSGLLA
jgi:ribosomal protein L25 (general stress protein Ctc)